MRKGQLGTLALICLVAATAGPANASFPGSNGSIAFTGKSSGFAGPCVNSNCIKVISPAGGSERMLDITSGADHPHYSPNGRMLVFDRPGRAGRCQIYTVHANGTHLRQVTHNLVNDAPAWSPDGKQIVFSRRTKSGTAHLYIVNADGTNLHALTTGAVGGTEPDWGTDGLIAFLGHGTGGNDIFVIDAGGTQQQNLTSAPHGGNSAPSWSPDGNWIAFVRGHNVWRMRADGTEKTKLTSTSSFKDHPAFSPDGTRIVYQDFVTGFSQLWVMHANGTHPRQLTHDTNSTAAPTWQPR